MIDIKAGGDDSLVESALADDSIRPNIDSLKMNANFRRLGRYDKISASNVNEVISPEQVNYTVLCDRTSFQTALKYPSTRRNFTYLLFAAKSVCFYDFLPSDKGKLVKLLKENFSFRPTVMAIGDGNNDIPMIQAADVGIGINFGKGLLSSYSDINIRHFSVLKDLLLIHGNNCYRNISKAILLHFYTSILLAVTLLIYNFYADISFISIFNSSQLILFVLIFTTVPIIFLGIFNCNPSFFHTLSYAKNINNKAFN